MRSSWRDYRGVFYPVGAVVMGLAWAMVLCAIAGYLFDLADPPPPTMHTGGEEALFVSAAITLLCGWAMSRYGRRFNTGELNRREAVLAVALIWVACGVFSGIPFVIGIAPVPSEATLATPAAELPPKPDWTLQADGLSPPAAFFEAVSGLTTTGATVITHIERRLSRSIMLWRSLIQWLGGMGIVVLFVSIFPNIGTGGKHMSAREVPGTSSEGLRPRIAETSRVLWKFYTAFTVLEILALYALGMSLFDAICHAFTTMSTGGFSTSDASIAAFQSPAIEYTISGFMLLGSVNYALFYAAFRTRSLQAIFRSVEFRVFAALVVVFTFLLTIAILPLHPSSPEEAFRYALFMVATCFSSTGYATGPYMDYPPAGLFIVIVIMFIGGCAGSTAGGIKVERIVMLTKLGWGQLQRSFRPNLVHVVRMGRTVISQAALTDVAVFFSIFMLSMALGTGAVALFEQVPLQTAFGAVLTSLSNMGPAPYHLNGQDNFASYTGASQLLLSVVMLLGRLEFYALLALLVPNFWRR